MFRDVIAVCSEHHTKYINMLSGGKLDFLKVKEVGTYRYHYTLKGQFVVFLNRWKVFEVVILTFIRITCEEIIW
jgi:hypothetical protein